MKSVRLLIEGRFEEAWLYMNHLLLLTDDGDVLVVSADEARDRINQMTPASLLAGVALFHSDFLYPSNRNQYIWHNRNRRGLREQVPLLPETELEIPLADLRVERFTIPSQADTPLDVHIYSRRVYLGSAGGLFSIDVEWGDSPGPTGEWRHRFVATCSSVAAKYGAFVASCGKEGLLSSVEDVYWLSPYDIPPGEVHKIRDESRRASWVQSSLVNYTYDAIEILTAERETIDPRKHIQVLRGFGEAVSDVAQSLSRTSPPSVTRGTIEVVGNAGEHFLTSDRQRNLRFVSVSAPKLRGNEVVIRSDRSLDVGPLEPLGLFAMKDGYLLEHYKGVGWIKDDRYEDIVSTGAGKVRTFPSSIRYKNVFSAILNEGVLIVGLFDEDQLAEPE
jgi:hypothetical protein